MRSQKWDNVKFILIFLVVLGHIADIYAQVSPLTGYIRYFIYTFHMPLFIFISGLFGKKNINLKRWDKLFSYLLLYLFIKVLIFASKWIANGTKPEFHIFSEGGAPWYVFCLFAFSLITMLTKSVKTKYVFVFSVLLACIAGYDNSIRDFLCLSRVIAYYPFYYLGYILEPEKVLEYFEKNKIIKQIISLIIIALTITSIVVLYENIENFKLIFTGRNPYSYFKSNCPYAFVFRLICYIVSSLLGFAVISLTPTKTKFGFLAKWGKKSLCVYVFHFPLMKLWYSLINKPLNLESFFVSKLIVYELIVAIVLTAVCLLPFWEKILSPLINCNFIKRK